MRILARRLWNDEVGFIISAELVFISTILVIGLVVGWTEIQTGVVNELNDVGEAIGRMTQSYEYEGMIGHKAVTYGSAFFDRFDFCDCNECDLNCGPIIPEAPKPVFGICDTGGTCLCN